MTRAILWSAMVAVGICAFAAAQPVTTGDARHIGDLIKLIGSTRFQERAAAKKKLEAIGWPALDQLRATVERSDLETSSRAAELVRQIEKNEIARDVLAPKRVRLNVTDMPVLEAVSLLAKESGYPIEVADNWSKLTAKKITLDTGLVPFWEVFETLRRISGLVERGPPPSGSVAFPLDGPAAIMVAPLDPYPVVASSKLVLGGGSPVKVNASIGGGVRVRLYEMPGVTPQDYRLLLDVTPEPRLQDLFLVGLPRISSAIADQGQERASTSEIVPKSPLRQRMLRFPPSEKPARTLKKLVGTLPAHIAGPSETIMLDKLSKPTGEWVQGKHGVRMKLISIHKSTYDFYEVRVSIENLVVGSHTTLELVDANGKPFQFSFFNQLHYRTNKLVNEEVTVAFFPHPGQGEPERLILRGNPSVNVSIPFAFENVPLE